MQTGRAPGAEDTALWHPTSQAQASLWLLEQTLADPAVYHIPFAQRLQGPADREALEAAFREAVDRHPALRMRFRLGLSGAVEQQVDGTTEVEVQRLDLGAGADAEARLRTSLRDLARGPFDLARGPLVRGLLVGLGETDTVAAFCVHHIVFDAWSMTVFLHTWRRAYDARRRGECLPPAPPGLTFLDHVQQLNHRLQGEPLARLKRHWTAHLQGAPDRLTLPTRLPRPRVQGTASGWVPAQLAPEVLDACRALARGERASLFMVLLAGFQLLLGRLSGQDDVVVGSPVSGRNHPSTWGTVGFFVNTLALRGDLSGNPTVRELLARTRERVLGAMAHQELPFEEVVRTLNPPRTTDHTPLFQAMLVHHQGPEREPGFAGLEELALPMDTEATAFDLTLTWWGGGGRLEYRADLFTADWAEAFLLRFGRLLEAMAAAPDTPIQDLPWMDAAETATELARGVGPTVPVQDDGAHAAVVRQAQLRPEATALVQGARTLSYRALEHLSRQVALGLQSRGLGPGHVVGLLMDPSLEQQVAQVGILRCGAAYLPLDPDHPVDRLQGLLVQAGVEWVLTTSARTDRLPHAGVRALALDLEALAGLDQPGELPSVSGTELACVIFTSGSTGVPKGVMVQHRSLVNVLEDMAERLDLGPGCRTLTLMALTFDPSNLERLLALRVGGEVHVLDRATVVNPFALAEAIRRAKPTYLAGTPALFQLLQQAEWQGDGRIQLITGGETLQGPLARYLLNQAGALWNVYGPTETTILSTAHRVGPEDLEDLPIGRPIRNTRVFVLDPALRPVPEVVTGELCLAGDGLARGYLGQPEATAQRFVEAPFEPGLRLYRSGDLARWRPDGTLAFGGRRDHQVKLRGYRIELEEIEAVLARHPEVVHAAVDLRVDGAGPRLVAFVIPRRPEDLDGESLRRHAKAALPAHMVPAQFLGVNALPMRGAKVDRPRLAGIPLPAADRGGLPPRGPTEWMLFELWRELLGRDDFGILDDFFDLGGHSLLVMRLADRIEEAFGRRVAPAVLFEEATIQRLGLALAGDAVAEDQPQVEVRSGAPDRRIFFLHGDLPGLGLYSRAIARALAEGWGFTVIHPPGMGGQPPAEGFDAMTTAHLALIRRLQPTGPYRLAGFCNGAAEALELARRLRAEGQAVPRVVLVAPDRPRREPGVVGPRELALEGSSHAMEAALGALVRAVASHVPGPYDGPVTLLLPDTPPPADPTLGWDRLLRDLEVRLIPGDHVTCLASPALGTELAAAFGAARST